MTVEIRFVGVGEFADAWMLLEEYFEAAQVVVRDKRDVLAKNAMWLAYVDGEPAGCIMLLLLAEAGTGEIKRLYVRSRFRRMGLAGRLLTALESRAVALGLRELYLDSMAEMSKALAFYQRSGYLPCERYNDNPQASVFLRKRLPGEVRVREFEVGDEEAFWSLNEAWISKLFKLETKDIETLRNPQKYVLDGGGRIYMACRDGERLGCCALMRLPDGSYELAKMGVGEAQRGKGVGRILLEFVVAEARRIGIQRLYIETNHVLKNAIHLYEAVGFRHIEPAAPSPYQRADVFMELLLPQAS